MMRLRFLVAVVVGLTALSGHAAPGAEDTLIVLRVAAMTHTVDGIQITLRSGFRFLVSDIDIDRDLTAAAQARLLERSARPVGAFSDTRLATPASSQAVPGDAQQILERKCAAEWETDFAMQAYCREQQQAAVQALAARDIDTRDLQTIRMQCAKEWPDDFNMRNYCEKQQIEALKKLR